MPDNLALARDEDLFGAWRCEGRRHRGVGGHNFNSGLGGGLADAQAAVGQVGGAGPTGFVRVALFLYACVHFSLEDLKLQ